MFIDSHCHFDFVPFSENNELYIQQAKAVGVKHLVVPSVGASNWRIVQQLSHQYPQFISYALGLHPYFFADHPLNAIADLDIVLAHRTDRCVAVGECGLDFAIVNPESERQIETLLAQCQLANRYQLPMIVHCRKAFPELIAVMKSCPPQSGAVYHAFTGSYQQAKQWVDVGFKIGVGGSITYERAKKTRQAIAKLPLECLLLETDAPDMPICGFQGQPNRPDLLPNIATALCELRSENQKIVIPSLYEKTCDFFNLNSFLE